ncbi:MAG: uridylate kinase [Planctomycetia bacterium]|nr:uridylate kinase [Planctomycetia bacterium]
MTQMCRRVIKLGGSLLDWPELVPSFRRWLSAQAAAVNVMVIGGGPIVDAIRRLDAQQQIAAEAAHWLSIRAMGLTADFVSGLLEEATFVRSLDELRFSTGASLQILDVERFLREDQSSADALPCGWEVTSDSIAARIAAVLKAGELVLLKSTLPAAPPTREGLAQAGLIDSYFARASRGLLVRIVNLRNPQALTIDLEVERERSGIIGEMQVGDQ